MNQYCNLTKTNLHTLRDKLKYPEGRDFGNFLSDWCFPTKVLGAEEPAPPKGMAESKFKWLRTEGVNVSDSTDLFTTLFQESESLG